MAKSDKTGERADKIENNRKSVERLVELEKSFRDEFGEDLTLQANVAAINRMLFSRMQANELLSEFQYVTNNFRENNKNETLSGESV